MGETADDARLIEVVEQFAAARGDAADERWAWSAMWRLMGADVAPVEVRGVLEEALRLTEQSQESPQELYGDVDAWARELVQQWRSEGRLVLAPDERVGLRDVAVDGFASAAWLNLLVMAVLLVRDGGTTYYTAGLLVLPIGLAMTALAILAVWPRVLRRRPAPVAVAAASVVCLAGTALMAGAFWLGHGRPVVSGGTGWLCVLSAAYALLSVVCDRVLPRREPIALTASLDDEEWERALAGVLRERAGLPESRVQSIVAEAGTHAAASGGSLEREFGRPEAYAARFAPDSAARHRRAAWLFAALAGLSAVSAFGAESTWSGLALTAIFGVLAGCEALRLRRGRAARR
ncbi:hypothetical protein [Nocardioides allogilvus]|uniref:hypothetical protein n=1 Tax=Nocardioides allogilvus TaxID=2072017 RepID=UPI000D3080AD|nr:hypothetical protein [Nocardioides allogilvus]